LGVLRAIDKLDKFGPEGVRLLLGEGRRDESGDFTKGAGLEAAAIERVIAFTAAKGADTAATIANLAAVVGDTAQGNEGVAELEQIGALVAAAGYDDGRVVIDPAVVRGLEYYTGPVFEAELTFDVPNEKGEIVRFGSVGGGGRYDGLVSRFRGEPVPATGFSIGVSRLFAALKAIKSLLVTDAAGAGPVVVLVMDRDEIGHYQRMVAALRQAGIRAELYLGTSGMKAQMKYADRRASPCVVIQGSNERAAGEVTIKDLALGAELAGLGKDRDDYLQKQAEAQFSVKEEDLVAAVRRVLARRTATV